MSTPRARTALRRNILVAACALGLAVFVGSVAERRDAVRTPPAEQQAKLAAARQQHMPEGSWEGSSAYPSPAPASGVESPAAKPVVLAVVTPWIEIARLPQYLQASSAERNAIRGLYWRICVEERIPPAQRASAYQQFLRDTTEPNEYLPEPQAVGSSPVDEATMRRACTS